MCYGMVMSLVGMVLGWLFLVYCVEEVVVLGELLFEFVEFDCVWCEGLVMLCDGVVVGVSVLVVFVFDVGGCFVFMLMVIGLIVSFDMVVVGMVVWVIVMVVGVFLVCFGFGQGC